MNTNNRYDTNVIVEYFEECELKDSIAFSDLQLAWLHVREEIDQEKWFLEPFEKVADSMDETNKYIAAYGQGGSCYILSYLSQKID